MLNLIELTMKLTSSGFGRTLLCKPLPMTTRIVIALIFLSVINLSHVNAQVTAIVCKQIIDGKSNTPLKATVILVEGDRIKAIGQKDIIPKGAQSVDLSTYTVLPGFIDLHCHPLGDADDDYQTYHLRNSSAAKALQGLKNVQGMLMAGWTAIRVPGDLDVGYAHFDLRNAINKGMFDGPRIFGAGHWISATGGGGDINFFSYEQKGVIVDGLVVDGPEEMRKAVRNEIKYGSDWIKLLVSGAFMTAGDNPQNVHFSKEELEVSIDEATRRDVPVMAHAHSAEAIKMSVRAGAKTIEHGSFLDDEGIKLMAEHGTYLVPTLTIGKWFLEFNEDSEALKKAIELTKQHRVGIEAQLTKAIKSGVRVVVGTDLTGSDPEYCANEFSELVRVGMTPMQAIQAGTGQAAEALGKGNEFGTLESGKLADLVAVKGDPLSDINLLKKVDFVMIGGKIVKNETRATNAVTTSR
jgi:imidazolonepropionase-like amidohydrolase